jgi:hypothetical protein
MRRKNDILWKGMMEEIFDDLLLFLFPSINQVVDIDRGFDFLDKELGEIYPQPDSKADTRFVDKLVKVHRLDGESEWFLVHLEVQGHSDRFFAERMFQYYYRIFDRYRKPVTALAIFTGQNGGEMPTCYTYSFLGTNLMYKYNTCCIADYSDEVLMNSNNPFAFVVLAAKMSLNTKAASDLVLMDKKLLIARLLHKKGRFSEKKIAAVLTFLSNYILFANPETTRIFEEQLDDITGKTNPMGIIEQVTEMRVEEKLKVRMQILDEQMQRKLDEQMQRVDEQMQRKLDEQMQRGNEQMQRKLDEQLQKVNEQIQEIAQQAKDEIQENIVKNLLSGTSFSSEKIASLAGVSLATVDKIRTGC